MARPSKYSADFCSRAATMCEAGATDQQVADQLGISIRSLYEYQSLHPQFAQALKTAKAPADDKVERSLFARAMGYEHDEVDIRVVNGEIVQTTVRKFYPPDTVACIFWLKNRRPDLWRDKTEIDVTKRSVNDMTDDELAKIAAGKAIAKAAGAKPKSHA